MAKTKMREVDNQEELFNRLGITNPEGIPGEAVTTEVNPPKTQQPAETVTTEEPAIQLEEEPEEPTQAKPKEIPKDETERRTWQAEADKAKSELLKTQEQIRLLQAQNQQLVGVVAPFMQKYGQQPGAAQTAQGDPDQEPSVDYVEDGYFDPKKFSDYQKRRDIWLSRRLKSEIKTDWQKEREQETMQQQLAAVANDFPEYVNPLTGQIDIDRVHRDLQAYTSKKTITDLIRESKGIIPAANGGKNPLQQTLSAIEKNADRPQAATASGEIVEKEKKPVSKQLEKLRKTFGDIELPPDFDGFIE